MLKHFLIALALLLITAGMSLTALGQDPGRAMMIRYTAVIKNGGWLEVGDRILPGREPVRFLR